MTASRSAATQQVHICAASLTEADLARFRALGADFCLFSPDVGEVWIVSEPSGKERTEITVEQVAVLVGAVAALPGSCVVALRRRGGG
jgi:hypothetical protein